jgi:conjugal transfer pilus assembly protein TraE
VTFADFIRTWRGQQLVMMGALALSAVLGLAVFGMVTVVKSREQIVVLVPPDLEGEASVTRSGASADYKRAWALFTAQVLGNITPANVGHLRQVLEPLLDARIYSEVIARLEAETDKVRRDRLSVRFEPRRVLVEEARDRVFVNGLSVVETLVGDTQRREMTYEMVISVRGYRPRIDFLNTYEGEPRTAAVLARREREDGREVSR